MLFTSSCDDLGDVSIDADIALRGMQETDISDKTGTIVVRQNLYPRETKRFMKEEKKCWLKGDTILLKANLNTTIIIPKLCQADRCGDLDITCHVTAKAFLPFTPSDEHITRPTCQRPHKDCGTKNDQHYIHMLSIEDSASKVKIFCLLTFFWHVLRRDARELRTSRLETGGKIIYCE